MCIGPVEPKHEEAFGVQRLARAHQVVPPAFLAGGIQSGDMVRGVQCMAHQHGVALVGVERAVGLVGQLVVGQARATLERERLAEVHRLRRDLTDRSTHLQTTRPGAAAHGYRVGSTCLAAFVKAPASRSKSALWREV
jgi:hypothetical protein